MGGTVVLWCDGSVNGKNNGAARIGAGAWAEGAVEFALSGVVGHGSNNEAEYYAVIYGLRALALMADPSSLRVDVKTDSKLVVEQINGAWSASGHLATLREEAREIMRGFKTCSIRHVPRHENQKADSLARVVWA